MSQPSPRPWSCDAGEMKYVRITGPDGNDVAEALYEPDAAHIVRCVNAFDTLLTACEVALAYAGAIQKHATDQSWVTSDELDNLFDEWQLLAKRAIAKATAF